MHVLHPTQLSTLKDSFPDQTFISLHKQNPHNFSFLALGFNLAWDNLLSLENEIDLQQVDEAENELDGMKTSQPGHDNAVRRKRAIAIRNNKFFHQRIIDFLFGRKMLVGPDIPTSLLNDIKELLFGKVQSRESVQWKPDYFASKTFIDQFGLYELLCRTIKKHRLYFSHVEIKEGKIEIKDNRLKDLLLFLFLQAKGAARDEVVKLKTAYEEKSDTTTINNADNGNQLYKSTINLLRRTMLFQTVPEIEEARKSLIAKYGDSAKVRKAIVGGHVNNRQTQQFLLNDELKKFYAQSVTLADIFRFPVASPLYAEKDMLSFDGVVFLMCLFLYSGQAANVLNQLVGFKNTDIVYGEADAKGTKPPLFYGKAKRFMMMFHCQKEAFKMDAERTSFLKFREIVQLLVQEPYEHVVIRDPEFHRLHLLSGRTEQDRQHRDALLKQRQQQDSSFRVRANTEDKFLRIALEFIEDYLLKGDSRFFFRVYNRNYDIHKQELPTLYERKKRSTNTTNGKIEITHLQALEKRYALGKEYGYRYVIKNKNVFARYEKAGVNYDFQLGIYAVRNIVLSILSGKLHTANKIEFFDKLAEESTGFYDGLAILYKDPKQSVSSLPADLPLGRLKQYSKQFAGNENTEQEYYVKSLENKFSHFYTELMELKRLNQIYSAHSKWKYGARQKLEFIMWYINKKLLKGKSLDNETYTQLYEYIRIDFKNNKDLIHDLLKQRMKQAGKIEADQAYLVSVPTSQEVDEVMKFLKATRQKQKTLEEDRRKNVKTIKIESNFIEDLYRDVEREMTTFIQEYFNESNDREKINQNATKNLTKRKVSYSLRIRQPDRYAELLHFVAVKPYIAIEDLPRPNRDILKKQYYRHFIVTPNFIRDYFEDEKTNIAWQLRNNAYQPFSGKLKLKSSYYNSDGIPEKITQGEFRSLNRLHTCDKVLAAVAEHYYRNDFEYSSRLIADNQKITDWATNAEISIETVYRQDFLREIQVTANIPNNQWECLPKSFTAFIRSMQDIGKFKIEEGKYGYDVQLPAVKILYPYYMLGNNTQRYKSQAIAAVLLNRWFEQTLEDSTPAFNDTIIFKTQIQEPIDRFVTASEGIQEDLTINQARYLVLLLEYDMLHRLKQKQTGNYSGDRPYSQIMQEYNKITSSFTDEAQKNIVYIRNNAMHNGIPLAQTLANTTKALKKAGYRFPEKQKIQ